MIKPLLFLALFFSMSAQAQLLTTSQLVERTHQQLIKPYWEVDYEMDTDLADRLDPRRYDHSLSFSPTFVVNKKWIVSTSVAADFYSLNNEVPVDNNLHLEDWQLGVSRVWSFNSAWGHATISAGGGNFFPISERSQFEGIRSIPYLRSGQILEIPHTKITVLNKLIYSYYMNTYEISPVTKKASETMGTSDTFSLIYSLTEHFLLTGFVGAKETQYYDGFGALNFHDGAAASYYFTDQIYASLSYDNGTYTDNQNVPLWYIDEYRQLVSVGFGATF